MTKKSHRNLTVQEKVEILSRHLLEGEDVRQVCERYRISRATLSHWKRELARRGVEAFRGSGPRPDGRIIRRLQKVAAVRKTPSRFTNQEKAEILSQRLLKGKSLREVCERYRISRATLSHWKRELARHGAEAFRGSGPRPDSRVIRRLQEAATMNRRRGRFSAQEAQEKVEILSHCLLEDKTVDEICERHKINRSTLSHWQRDLVRFGTEAFKGSGPRPATRVVRRLQEAAVMKITQPRLMAPEKIEILSQYLLEDKTIDGICERHGIKRPIFYRWLGELVCLVPEAVERSGSASTIRKLWKEVARRMAELGRR